MDYEGASDAFVNSPYFYDKSHNGAQIAKHTFLGRYLCFSALLTETQSWKKSELTQTYHRMKPDQIQKTTDRLAARFHTAH